MDKACLSVIDFLIHLNIITNESLCHQSNIVCLTRQRSKLNNDVIYDVWQRLKLELIPRSVYPLPSQSRRIPWQLAGSRVVVTMSVGGGRDTMTVTYVFIKHYSSFIVCSFCTFVIGSHCSVTSSRINDCSVIIKSINHGDTTVDCI